MSYFFDSLTGQPHVITMGLTAMVTTQLSVEIDILHGFYIAGCHRCSRAWPTIATHYPNRA